jgi:hypothetical protein
MGIDCKQSVIPDSPENGDLPTSAIAPLIDALTTCINSIHQSLEAILSVDPQRLTCLPTVSLARTSYPVVSLIKIYSLLTASETRIGQVIDMQSLKLEYYLEKVINHYRAAAALDEGRAPAKFGNIIMMLRNWFVKKKENGPALREIFGTEMRSDTLSDKPARPQFDQMKQGATPLDLLSEVATGNQSSRAPSNGSIPHRSHSGQEPLYSPATMNQNIPSSTTPGAITFGPAEARTTSWPTPSFTPSMAGHTDPNMGSRAFYQPFTPTDRATPYTVPSTMGDTYADMSGMLGQSRGLDAGLGMEETFDPDNLFALGTMMDEGLFSFPLAFDGNFQF